MRVFILSTKAVRQSLDSSLQQEYISTTSCKISAGKECNFIPAVEMPGDRLALTD